MPGTEYCRVVNGRYFPCLFSITSREIVVDSAAAAAVFVGGICTAMIRIGTCIRYNGKFCTPPFVANILPLPRYPPRFSSLRNERDFPRETLKSIKVARFRSSDLSSPRDGGWRRGSGEIKLSVLVVSVDLSIGKQYRTVSNLIFQRPDAKR